MKGALKSSDNHISVVNSDFEVPSIKLSLEAIDKLNSILINRHITANDNEINDFGLFILTIAKHSIKLN